MYRSSGLLARSHFAALHCYTNGRPYADRRWGGQFLQIDTLGKPIHITETNDNQAFFAENPTSRALDYASYAGFCRDRGVDSLSLFHLPGGVGDAHEPPWWLLTPEILSATSLTLRTAPADLLA